MGKYRYKTNIKNTTNTNNRPCGFGNIKVDKYNTKNTNIEELAGWSYSYTVRPIQSPILRQSGLSQN